MSDWEDVPVGTASSPEEGWTDVAPRPNLSEMTLYPDVPKTFEPMEYGGAPETRLPPGHPSRMKYEPGYEENELDPEMAGRAVLRGAQYGWSKIAPVNRQSPEEKKATEKYLEGRVETPALEMMGTLINPMFTALGAVSGAVGRIPAATRLLGASGREAIGSAVKAGPFEGIKIVKSFLQQERGLFRRFMEQFVGAGGRVETLARGLSEMELAESGDEERARQLYEETWVIGGALEAVGGMSRMAGAFGDELSKVRTSPEVQRTARRAPQIIEEQAKLQKASGKDIPVEEITRMFPQEEASAASALSEEASQAGGLARGLERSATYAAKNEAERKAATVDRIGREQMSQAKQAADEMVSGTEKAFVRKERELAKDAASAQTEISRRYDARISDIEQSAEKLTESAKREAGKRTSRRMMAIRRRMDEFVNEVKDDFGREQKRIISEVGDSEIDTSSIMDLLDSVTDSKTVSAPVKERAQAYKELFSTGQALPKGTEGLSKSAQESIRKQLGGGEDRLSVNRLLENSRKVPYVETDSSVAAFNRKVRGVVSKTMRDEARKNPALRPLTEINEAYSTSLDRLDPIVDRIKPWDVAGSKASISPWMDSEIAGEMDNLKGLGEASLERLGRRIGVDKKYADTFKRIMRDTELTAQQHEDIIRRSQMSGKPLAQEYAAEKKAVLGEAKAGFEKRGEVLAAKKKAGVEKMKARADRIVYKKQMATEGIGKSVKGKIQQRLQDELDTNKKTLGELSSRLEEKYRGVPKDMGGWYKLLTEGTKNDFESAGLIRVSSPTINGKANPEYRPQIARLLERIYDIKSANQMGGLFKSLVGEPLAKGISFGPGVTAKRFVQSMFSPEVQGSLVLKSPKFRAWVMKVQESGIDKNPEFINAVKSVWPRGMPARIALYRIFSDENKAAEFADIIDGMGE